MGWKGLNCQFARPTIISTKKGERISTEKMTELRATSRSPSILITANAPMTNQQAK